MVGATKVLRQPNLRFRYLSPSFHSTTFTNLLPNPVDVYVFQNKSSLGAYVPASGHARCCPPCGHLNAYLQSKPHSDSQTKGRRVHGLIQQVCSEATYQIRILSKSSCRMRCRWWCCPPFNFKPNGQRLTWTKTQIQFLHLFQKGRRDIPVQILTLRRLL